MLFRYLRLLSHQGQLVQSIPQCRLISCSIVRFHHHSEIRAFSTSIVNRRKPNVRMPGVVRTASEQQVPQVPNGGSKLIVCFDGTGNAFAGTPGDTNIVKLYNMFDRGADNQMHYYQPGIGTYPAEGPVNVTLFRSFLRKIEAVIDQALATSFDSHVIAGYKFIMRYYNPGDRIYIFGFSRGAYTARFVARMISHIGLLSKGNEELVPFAYKVYQDYEQNRSGPGQKQDDQVKYMNSFKKHFCRTERATAEANGEKISDNESGIKVHFLGLFDCVSSVGNLDIPFFKKQPPLPAVVGTARHVRHAVAIDERRVKFKAALFEQEKPSNTEDIKEVWFPGNHGDVGGGWDIPAKETGTAHDDTSNDYFQLSDIALKWMVDEIDDVELKQKNPDDRIQWDPETKADFLTRFAKNKDTMIGEARMHDTMTIGGGSGFFKSLLWKWMETIPFIIKRWEYVKKSRSSDDWEWRYIGWPVNFGGRRDIPSRALFHHSVLDRMRVGVDVHNKPYLPSNLLWVAKHIEDEGESNTKLEVRKLDEVARQFSGRADQSKTNGVSTSVGGITFVHDRAATKGSVAVEGSDVEITIGAVKWDRLYRVLKMTN